MQIQPEICCGHRRAEDFCPDSALLSARRRVVPVINRPPAFRSVVLTQDWHPAGHSSFASSHPGSGAFRDHRHALWSAELWPDHCVQGTPVRPFIRNY